MTVDFFYTYLQMASNKAQMGYLSPAQFNLIANQASTDLSDYLLGSFQSYQYGKPIAKVQWGMNEIVRQRLTPLIGQAVALTTDGTGLASYPSGFQQVDAMWQPGMATRVRYVPQHKLYSYLNSQIDPINTNPIFTIETNGFRFYPNTTYNGTAFTGALLSYVSTPPTIVWNYTLDGNGRPVYNPTGSQDPIYYETDNSELLSRALKILGVNLQLNELTQIGLEIEKNGG